MRFRDKAGVWVTVAATLGSLMVFKYMSLGQHIPTGCAAGTL